MRSTPVRLGALRADEMLNADLVADDVDADPVRKVAPLPRKLHQPDRRMLGEQNFLFPCGGGIHALSLPTVFMAAFFTSASCPRAVTMRSAYSLLLVFRPVLFRQIRNLRVFFQNTPVIFAPVRDHAAAAVLITGCQILKVAAALVAEGVERTVAEKTVEIFRFIRLMAGEILAVRILEERIPFPFPFRLDRHIASPLPTG